MLTLTHLLFGAAFGVVAKFPLVPFLIGSVLPDMDTALTFSFPLMHRGIVHTPLFLAFTAAMIYLAVRRRDYAFAYSLGFLSHLFLDTINPTGILWLYPLETFFTLNMATYSNTLVNTGIMAWSLALAYFYNLRWKTIYGPRNV